MTVIVTDATVEIFLSINNDSRSKKSWNYLLKSKRGFGGTSKCKGY